MKNLSVLLAAALIGLLSIIVLNTTPLAHLGVGVNLPFAWRINPAPNYTVDCDVDRKGYGIPFQIRRVGTVDPCQNDTNQTALYLNGLAGIVVAPLFVVIADRHSRKR